MSMAIEDLSVHYGGVVAADHVAIEIEPGKVVGLIGPNGSGKTTVVNATTGYARKAAGTVTRDGLDLTRKSPTEIARSGVRRTFQGARWFPRLTLTEHIEVTAGAGRRAAEGAELAAWASETLGFSGLGGSAPGDLPYGTQRNLGLLLAVAGAPEYLLLDEPASGLHHHELEKVARVIEGLAEAGTGVLLIDHHMGFIRQIADELVVMNAGQVLARGNPEEVLAADSVREVYLGRHS